MDYPEYTKPSRDYPDYTQSGWVSFWLWVGGWLGLAAVLTGLILALRFVFSLF